MKYNFDKIINRRNTNSTKWDSTELIFQNKDVFPMWVADMDFEVSPAIKKAVIKRAEHGIYGYPASGDDFFQAIINWQAKRHNLRVKKEWIVITPGIVPAINFAIQSYSNLGDQVLIQTPVYYPFIQSVINNGRKLITNQLVEQNGNYQIDFKDLEEKMSDPKTKMMIISSPHNPVGKVFTKEELKKIADLCLKYELILVSDEIHQDIIYKNYKQYPTLLLDDNYQKNVISCVAPSKTFNIAGLKTSAIIIPNENFRKKFEEKLLAAGLTSVDLFGIEATIAAYNQGEDWLEELLIYLEKNIDYLEERFAKIAQIDFKRPQGTYLAWLDCRKLKMNAEQLRDFFINKVGLGLNEGKVFGEGGEGFHRLNFACPRTYLEKALDMIENSLK